MKERLGKKTQRGTKIYNGNATYFLCFQRGVVARALLGTTFKETKLAKCIVLTPV